MYRDRARRRGAFSRHLISARPRPPLAFSIAEQNYLLGVLDSERFADTAPATIYATLLDEGHYYGSVRTMYRLLAAQSQAGDRRGQRRHPVYTKPELLAIRPNEVWSWDISKLKGPTKWTCFHLYVILDIFLTSRRASVRSKMHVRIAKSFSVGTTPSIVIPASHSCHPTPYTTDDQPPSPRDAASHLMPLLSPIRLASRASHRARPAYRSPPGSIHPKRTLHRRPSNPIAL